MGLMGLIIEIVLYATFAYTLNFFYGEWEKPYCEGLGLSSCTIHAQSSSFFIFTLTLITTLLWIFIRHLSHKITRN